MTDMFVATGNYWSRVIGMIIPISKKVFALRFLGHLIQKASFAISVHHRSAYHIAGCIIDLHFEVVLMVLLLCQLLGNSATHARPIARFWHGPAKKEHWAIWVRRAEA